MTDLSSIVQVVVLYVTVMLAILLYVAVLRRKLADDHGKEPDGKKLRNLTFALGSVITMIFGVGCAHEVWPQANGLWFALLGILILSVAWIVHRLRRIPPNTN